MDEERPDRPINLEKRRLARELESRFGGIFGIDIHDIENAIERIWEAVPSEHNEKTTRNLLPENVEKTADLCEIIAALGENTANEGDARSLIAMLELIRSLENRLRRMLESE